MPRIACLLFLSCFAMLSTQAAFADDGLMKNAQATFKPIPTQAPVLEGNVMTPDKLELGKMLYFEPRLSKSGLISCNTCHNVGLGGADFQETSTGHGWQRGPRNAPTVLNSVFNVAQFWDGRAKDLAEQAKGPVQAGVEMNNTPENVVATLKSMPEYVALFKAAFPKDKDPVNFDNMAKAIEIFEATLLTPNSDFDKYLAGDPKAMNEKAVKGLAAFMENSCQDCHAGVNMGGDDYYPFGVVESPEADLMAGDRGRYMVTETEEDNHAFKSPSLRNIELTTPYFHSGKVWDLKEAVAIMGSTQLGADLSEEDIDNIVEFLKATTGEQPKVEHPILPAPTAATPIPVLN